MPTPTEQLLSRTIYDTDGVSTIWDFSFESGYLDPSHVKAYTTDALGARTDITVTPVMLVGTFQLQITPALADGLVLTIYRDTPKNAPLVNFMDESGFSEIALDTNAKQAIMVAAEAIDTITTSDLSAAIDAADQASLAAVAAQAAAAAAAASVSSIGTAVTDAEAAADAAIAAAATINPANFATAAQGTKADTALQPTAIGVTVASQANGALAATALQPGAIGVTVQAYSAATAKTDTAQSFTAPQRAALLTDNDLSFDLGAKQNFKATPTAGGTLTFTNIPDGQSGYILLFNPSAYAITAAATTKINATDLSAISAAGTYRLDYASDGTNVYVSVTRSFA